MRRSLSALLLSSLLFSCLGQPKTFARPLGATVSLAQGTGDGAASLQVLEAGANLELPTGTCTFRLDPSEPRTFSDSAANPSRDLKVSGRRGKLTIDPVGGRQWTGSGRLTVNWPNYPDGETFELRMDAVASPDGNAGPAACKYQIANGVGIEWYASVQ